MFYLYVAKCCEASSHPTLTCIVCSCPAACAGT